MPASAYYNDNDPYICRWIPNLIEAGFAPEGTIDDRSIAEVRPADVERFERVHLFAGILGWEAALRLAGWNARRPVWTASCPCPPFSVAGKKRTCPECKGPHLVWCPRRTGYAICAACEHAWAADGRHLWPEVWRLAAVCRPPVIFGEQVAGDAGDTWMAAVRASMEILSYAVRSRTIPASSVGAPHRRYRIYWMAVSKGEFVNRKLRQRKRRPQLADSGRMGNGVSEGLEGQPGNGSRRREPGRVEAQSGGPIAKTGGTAGRISIPDGYGRPQGRQAGPTARYGDTPEPESRGTGRLANPERHRDAERAFEEDSCAIKNRSIDSSRMGRMGNSASDDQRRPGQPEARRGSQGATRGSGMWSLDECEWLPFIDGKRRPAPYGLCPLAPRLPGRVGKLRAYGNVVVPQAAAAFISECMDILEREIVES